MRFVGRVSSWNETKGYGFVEPHGGGVRAFVHIKAFVSPARRPVDGDLVSYAVKQDARGRSNAVQVRFAAERIVPRKAAPATARIPRTAIAGSFLALVTIGTLLGGITWPIPAIYVAMSCLSYVMYYQDKAAAGHGSQRIPEAHLHLVDLLGGWPGALLAPQQFRHKTVKGSFQAVFWLAVVVNTAAAGWLVHSKLAQLMTDALFGGASSR